MWPLAAVTLVAAALRLSTLGQQSLWYDEAFTPVHVLRASLGVTLHGLVRTENTPPLWYVLEWAGSRVLGTGAVDLRLLSALAGIATVPVVWAIAHELAGPRAALAAGALAAVNPLFVWYSQEARAYGLFVLTAALAMLCFVRALREPAPMRLVLFGLSACAALLTHYFAVFLVIPMMVWLAVELAPAQALSTGRAPSPGRPGRAFSAASSAGRAAFAEAHRVCVCARARWPLTALAIPTLTGVALLPLVLAQAGHGTQWIGKWPLASRLEAIPQYYLTGYSGAPLGHGVEVAVALVALAGVAYGLWSVLGAREERAALLALVIAGAGVLVPIALALLGADYLAPRNLVAAMVPVTVLLAIVITARRTGWVGPALAGLLALAFAAITIDVDLSPRLQRGDWEGVARVLGNAAPRHAIATVELGSAPLEYYLPGLRPLARRASVAVSEIDEAGYAPLRASAGRPPAPGFRLMERRNVNGLLVYRFVSQAPVRISGEALRQDAITDAPPAVLVPDSLHKAND